MNQSIVRSCSIMSKYIYCGSCCALHSRHRFLLYDYCSMLWFRVWRILEFEATSNQFFQNKPWLLQKKYSTDHRMARTNLNKSEKLMEKYYCSIKAHTLSLPTMGWINPCTVITWYRPVGIGLSCPEYTSIEIPSFIRRQFIKFSKIVSFPMK